MARSTPQKTHEINRDTLGDFLDLFFDNLYEGRDTLEPAARERLLLLDPDTTTDVRDYQVSQRLIKIARLSQSTFLEDEEGVSVPGRAMFNIVELAVAWMLREVGYPETRKLLEEFMMNVYH